RWKGIFADRRAWPFGQRRAGGLRCPDCNNQRKANCARRFHATSSRRNSEIVTERGSYSVSNLDIKWQLRSMAEQRPKKQTRLQIGHVLFIGRCRVPQTDDESAKRI